MCTSTIGNLASYVHVDITSAVIATYVHMPGIHIRIYIIVMGLPYLHGISISHVRSYYHVLYT